jgi:preprotein translocase subunit SecG
MIQIVVTAVFALIAFVYLVGVILMHSHPIAGNENGLEKSVCPATRQG